MFGFKLVRATEYNRLKESEIKLKLDLSITKISLKSANDSNTIKQEYIDKTELNFNNLMTESKSIICENKELIKEVERLNSSLRKQV